MLIPVDKLLAKLSAEGFLKNYAPGKKIIPSAKTSWIFLSHQDIVSRYNMLTRGLLNYYAIATNRYAFHSIINFIMRHSCAKTLARKFNLRTRAKVFAKFGKDLTAAEAQPQSTKTTGDIENAKDKKGKPGISFYTEPHYKRLLKWPEHTKLVNPFEFLKWALRTQKNFWKPCLICGTTENIEMHHVKHIRKTNKKATGFTKLMSALNRKQIPVCSNCHVEIHNGKYDGISLKDLWNPKKSPQGPR